MQNVQHESYGGPVVNDTYLTAMNVLALSYVVAFETTSLCMKRDR